jgi:hypothetical protein
MRPSSGARFYAACAKGPAELGRRLPTCPGPRCERRGFSLGPLSTSSAAVRACSGDVAIAQIAVNARRGERVKSIRSRPSISDPKRRFGFHRKFRASAGVCHVNDRRLASIRAIEADARPDGNGGCLAFVLDSCCLWGRRIVSKKLCSFQRAPEFGRDGSLEPGYDLARLLCAARSDDQGRDRRMSRDELRGG